jgi:hypothetical protein
VVLPLTFVYAFFDRACLACSWGTSRLNLKGQEKMNIFEKEIGIIGDAQVEHLKLSYEEFMQQAHDIRTRLGKQAYLLDGYLPYLFKSINVTLAYQAASDGFDAGGELNSLCLGVIRDGNKYKKHPFYEHAKEYIDAHPLEYQDINTKASLYCSMLAYDFLKVAAEQYFDVVKGNLIGTLNILDLRDLYVKICELLGSEEAMESLNLLFCQRFLIATTMDVFLQGMTNELLYSLDYRDRETSKQVFQLLLDGGELK